VPNLQRHLLLVLVVVVTGVVLVAAGTAGAARLAPRVVGGTKIGIKKTPWQVYVQARVKTASGGIRTYSCGGSILNKTTILTAGHCVYDEQTDKRFVAGAFVVVAGASKVAVSDPAGGVKANGGDAHKVASVAVHPYYAYNASPTHVVPDDVAILKLATGLTNYGKATEKPVPVVKNGLTPTPGTGGVLSGYGRQSPSTTSTPNGSLYALGVKVVDPYSCGGFDDALVTCVSNPSGSACQGDSGGPLVVAGYLVGVSSYILRTPSGAACGGSAVSGYVNLAAAEVRTWIAKRTKTPPKAPHGGLGLKLSGVPRVGSTLTCSPGVWNGSPHFAYAFINGATGAVLQLSSSSRYTLGALATGSQVSCRVYAANAGGTTQIPTVPTPPVAAAPLLVTTAHAAHSSGRSGGTMNYTLRAYNRGSASAHSVIVCADPGHGLAYHRRPHHVRRHRGGYCWHLGTIHAGKHDTLHLTLRLGHTHSTRTRTLAISIDSSGTSRRLAHAHLLVRHR
jgi:secreted trypsin-like serine protease